MPTTWRSRAPVTVLKRGVSWLSSSVQELSVASQGTPARNARMTATASAPPYEGAGALEKTSSVMWPPLSHHQTGRRKPA